MEHIADGSDMAGGMEVAIAALENPAKWEQCIPLIQFEFNNTKSSTTKQSPNEITQGFTLHDISAAATKLPSVTTARVGVSVVCRG